MINLKKDNVVVVFGENESFLFNDLLNVFREFNQDFCVSSDNNHTYCVYYDACNKIWTSTIGRRPYLMAVTIQELRNILAREHLKPGDICVFELCGKRSLKRFDSVRNWACNESRFKVYNSQKSYFYATNFIRYATEEEKSKFLNDEFLISCSRGNTTSITYSHPKTLVKTILVYSDGSVEIK